MAEVFQSGERNLSEYHYVFANILTTITNCIVNNQLEEAKVIILMLLGFSNAQLPKQQKKDKIDYQKYMQGYKSTVELLELYEIMALAMNKAGLVPVQKDYKSTLFGQEMKNKMDEVL